MAALDKGMEHFMFASLGAKQHQMVSQEYHSRTAKPHCSHSAVVCQVLDNWRLRELDAGHVIITQGDKGDAVYSKWGAVGVWCVFEAMTQTLRHCV